MAKTQLFHPFMHYTLFHTAGCHLCEDAHRFILLAFARLGLNTGHLTLTDIVSNDALLSRYGLSIPVLRAEDTGDELNWPFSLEQLEIWLVGRTSCLQPTQTTLSP